MFPQLNSNVPPWNGFNFDTQNRTLGGFLEFSNIYVSPWYLRADANQLRQTGINLTSSSAGTSPGNGFVDLPYPVDYVTNNWSVEGGYTTKEAQLSVNFLKSKFTNDNESLRWTNPFFAGNNFDTTTLPPDNDLWKASVNGALRQLPWGSTLAGRVTYSQLTNSVGILGSVLNGGPPTPYTASNPSDSTFSGKVRNTSATVSLTSTPLTRVDTRLYYNYYERKNESNQITFFAPTLGCPAPAFCQTELFGYTKNNAGVDVSYRFNPQNRLTGADRLHPHRPGPGRLPEDQAVDLRPAVAQQLARLPRRAARRVLHPAPVGLRARQRRRERERPGLSQPLHHQIRR